MAEINEEQHDKAKEVLALAEAGRSPLAQAMLEDESVRLASQNRAKAYIDKCEAEKDDMPAWMWNLLYFILGMLFCMSEPAMFNLVWNIIKAQNGG